MQFKQFINISEDFFALMETLDPVTRRNRKEMINHFLKLNKYSPWNAAHSLAVTKIARDFGKYLKLDVSKIVKGALTHDVGKIAIPKNILHKPGKLGAEERSIMDTHSPEAERHLNSLTGEHGAIARLGAKFHHTLPSDIDELVINNELTLEEAKIIKVITIADIFEALTSNARPYKEAMAKADAIELMRSLKIIDQELLKLFADWQYQDFANEYRTTIKS